MRLLVQEHRGLGAAGDSNHKMGFLLPMNLLHLFEQNNEQNKRVQDKKVERERGGIGAPSCTRLFPKDPPASRRSDFLDLRPKQTGKSPPAIFLKILRDI
jgi:hypothetical protein